MAESEFTVDTDDPKYLHALGEFMATFAGVEHVLNSAVWHYADLREKPAIAKALFGHLRVDAATSHLTRLIEARKLKGRKIALLRAIITQVGHIAKTRNDIVHLGATRYGKGSFVVTNRRFAHTQNRIRATYVGVGILRKMVSDLQTMFGLITILADDLAPGYKLAGVKLMYGYPNIPTWRYKSRGRVARPHRRRAKPQARQHPPQSPSG